MNKKEIIRSLETIAIYMELKGENTFKISAYRKAAQALERDERAISELDDPASLNGIGKGTAAVIEELKQTGRSEVLESLKKEIPDGLVPLLMLPGLGGKKLARLYQELGVTDVESLKAACEQKKVQALSGFGAKSEEKILDAIHDMGARPERLPVAFMLNAADVVEAELENMTGIQRFERAGSLRRMRETVKDLDYILSVEDADHVRQQLIEMNQVETVINDGKTKVSVELQLDVPVQVDFRLVDDDAFATTLHHFTGSKDHNVLMRQLAKAQGEKISEYGIENLETGDVLTCKTEEEFFNHFGLHYIPPEVREGHDETERFITENVPLITENDILGDFHMHSTWSDGGDSIQEMADAAAAKGYEWIAITDHSKFLRVANGLNEERLKRQREEIDRLNEKNDHIHILAGIEMDILPNATLDFDDDMLKQLDLVIASIHSSFSQDRETIHQRLDAALSNPYVNIIAHPTGRLIGRRKGYDIDVEWLIERAVETGTALELNANPNRLDLAPEWLQMGADKGAVLTINTDAHRTETLHHMAIGAGVARKGWLTKDHVLNAWSLDEVQAFINKKRKD